MRRTDRGGEDDKACPVVFDELAHCLLSSGRGSSDRHNGRAMAR